MKTIRWFRVTIPKKYISSLGKSLVDTPFSEQTGEGFSIVKMTDNIIAGRYIKSKKFIKEVTTPSGDVNTITGTDYSTVDFKFNLNELSILEIYSKPRTIKPFINIISSIVGMGFSIDKIKIDLLEFIDIIELNFGKTKITKIVITDLNINNKALGHLTITSDQDVRNVINNQITLGRNYSIKYIKACFVTGNYYNGYLELDNLSGLTTHNLSHNAFINDYMKIFINYLLGKTIHS